MDDDRLEEHMREDERALGRLEGQVQQILSAITADREERRALDAKLFGNDGALVRIVDRLGALERWRSRLAGAVAVIVGAVAWITTVLWGR